MFELHCEICARAGGGTPRISRDTLIAMFKPEDVSLPFDGAMFLSPMPERAIPAPWLPGATWDWMHCTRAGRRHLPWMGVGDESILAKMAIDGGPAQLLTNRGTFTIGDNGLEEEEYKHQQTEEELEQEWFERVRESMSSAEDELGFIKEQRKLGKTYKQIGEILGKSKDTIARAVRGRKKQ